MLEGECRRCSLPEHHLGRKWMAMKSADDIDTLSNLAKTLQIWRQNVP